MKKESKVKLDINIKPVEKMQVDFLGNVKLVTIKGEDGEDGLPGITPILGEDYWTEADKKEIVDQVMGMIRMPEDGEDGEDGEDADPVDYIRVEKYISDYVDKLPKPKDGESVDFDAVVSAVLGKMPEKGEIQVDYPSIEDFIKKQMQKFRESTGGYGRIIPSNGVNRLVELTDVVISSPTDGQALVYDSALGKWKNATAAGSITSSDGSLTISPTTGDVIASINRSHDVNWLVTQTFKQINIADTGTGLSLVDGSVVAGESGLYGASNAKIATYNSASNYFKFADSLIYINNSTRRIGIGTITPGTFIGFETTLLELADDTGLNSDVLQRVAGGGWGAYQFAASAGTLAAPALTILNNTTFGEIDFYGYDGTKYKMGAMIRASVDGIPSAGSMPGVLKFYTTSSISSGPLERMRIEKNGRMGIGTTAPDKILEVNLGTADAFRLTYNDANGSATTYLDTTISSDGITTFDAVGSASSFFFPDPVTVNDIIGNIGRNAVGLTVEAEYLGVDGAYSQTGIIGRAGAGGGHVDTGSIGVKGEDLSTVENNGAGVYGSSINNYGVVGSTSSSTLAGVYGTGKIGSFFISTASGTDVGYGILGNANGVNTITARLTQSHASGLNIHTIGGVNKFSDVTSTGSMTITPASSGIITIDAVGASAKFTFSDDVETTKNFLFPTTSSTVGQIKQNGTAILHTYGTQNVFLGPSAGNFTLTGASNVGLGRYALNALSSGGGNVAVGDGAMYQLTTGQYNLSFGAYALSVLLTGSYNTAIGVGSGARATEYNNTYIGGQSGYAHGTGSENVMIGFNVALNAANGYATMASTQNTLVGSYTDAAPSLTKATCLGYGAYADTSNTIVLGTANETTIIKGAFKVKTITNDTGLSHGTYTPTLSDTTNITASTPRLATYMRVGNTVTVAGQLDIDPTAVLTATLLGISLPIASNFSTVYQLGGTAAATAVADNPAGIEADPTNNRASLVYLPVEITNHTMSYQFTYQVI